MYWFWNSTVPETQLFLVHVQLVSFRGALCSSTIWEFMSHLACFTSWLNGSQVVIALPLLILHPHFSLQFLVIMDWLIPYVWLSYWHNFTPEKYNKKKKELHKKRSFNYIQKMLSSILQNWDKQKLFCPDRVGTGVHKVNATYLSDTLKSLRNWSQQKQPREVFYIKSCSQASNFTKKEILAQVFSYEFCKIYKNTFFTEHPRATAPITTIDLSKKKKKSTILA